LRRDPHLNAVDLVQFEDHPTEGRTAAIRSSIRFDGETSDVRCPAQPRGAQTQLVLSELGYTVSDVNQLLSTGAATAASLPADSSL
jgi:crotonobetainyl-CoA:carnitine CoA-transferase CaiB-like acyl-CoA transferase